MTLIDIGVNLAHKRFDKDRDDVVARAHTAGVETMVVTGVNLQGSQEALQLCETYQGLVTTAGVHPHYASTFDEATALSLRSLLSDERVVAVGECGLDFNRNFSTPHEQETCFAAQLELATQVGKPLFLHQREAAPQFLAMIKEHRDQLKSGVVHCFTDSEEDLRGCLDLDLHIGITGWICDERRGTHLRDLVRIIPEDRLMIETDAPFLLPRTIRPRPKSNRNEPMWLPKVLETVAECLGKTPEEVAERTTAVAREFFGLGID